VGKSVTLRMLAERLAGLRDVQVGVLSRPQAGMAEPRCCGRAGRGISMLRCPVRC
jgi:hypothetical protein